jgi:serine/threonine protein phosphatase PrpC
LANEPETTPLDEGVSRAIQDAHKATCAQWPNEPADNEPGSTIVCALIFSGRAYVGWLGDSRAYCVTNDAITPLTRDHSWVNEALDRGDIKNSMEVRGALAHTITHCIGPLEESTDVTPGLREFELPEKGAIILCSDGLWNEAIDATIALIARPAIASHGASVVARHLLNFALIRGGHDNISVAVHTFTRA